jgi:PAS domain S-box-containing protein
VSFKQLEDFLMTGRPTYEELEQRVRELEEEAVHLGEVEKGLRLYRTIVESSQEAIAISDPDGQLVYINPAYEKLFGRSLEEAHQLNHREYYTPESVEVIDSEVEPALARGESWKGILDVFDMSGRRFPLWEWADTVRDANGKVEFAFGLMHDVSDRKQADDALRESQQRLDLALDAGGCGMWDFNPMTFGDTHYNDRWFLTTMTVGSQCWAMSRTSFLTQPKHG